MLDKIGNVQLISPNIEIDDIMLMHFVHTFESEEENALNRS